MSERERLWRALEAEASRAGVPARFPLYYRGDEHLRLDVELVDGEPRVRVTDALVRQLKRVEKSRPRGRELAGWENYAQRVRENQGALVSLNTATQAVCVPLASPSRTTLNVNVFRELHVRPEDLSSLLPSALLRRVEGSPPLSIEQFARELFGRGARRRLSTPQPVGQSAAEQRPPYSPRREPARPAAPAPARTARERPAQGTQRAEEVRRDGEPEVLFSWLHLSDLHFGHGSTSHGWDQHLVMEELRRDAAGLAAEGLPAPAALFVTGDIAFSGGVAVRGASGARSTRRRARSSIRSAMRFGSNPGASFSSLAIMTCSATSTRKIAT